ncbi:hypothetical protein JCM10212_005575 [Sporobolomyces blumeae]
MAVSSPSRSSSPPRPRPFDRLPTKLVQLVFDHLGPAHYDTRESYQARQDSLRNACLVSSRFRQVAQPLLAKIVVLDRPLETVDENHAVRKVLIRLVPSRLVLNCSYNEIPDSSTLEALADLFAQVPRLVELAIDQMHDLMQLDTVPCSLVASLSTKSRRLTRSICDDDVQTLMPQLEVLQLDAVDFVDKWGSTWADKILFDLDCLDGYIGFDPERVVTGLTHVSLWVRPYDLEPRRPPSVINMIADTLEEILQKILVARAESSNPDFSALETLIVPSTPQGMMGPARHDLGAWSRIDSLARDLIEHGVDVVREKPTWSIGVDSFLSPAFCRKARAKRLLQESKVKEMAQSASTTE